MAHLLLINFGTNNKRRDQMHFHIADDEAPKIIKHDQREENCFEVLYLYLSLFLLFYYELNSQIFIHMHIHIRRGWKTLAAFLKDSTT